MEKDDDSEMFSKWKGKEREEEGGYRRVERGYESVERGRKGTMKKDGWEEFRK